MFDLIASFFNRRGGGSRSQARPAARFADDFAGLDGLFDADISLDRANKPVEAPPVSTNLRAGLKGQGTDPASEESVDATDRARTPFVPALPARSERMPLPVISGEVDPSRPSLFEPESLKVRPLAPDNVSAATAVPDSFAPRHAGPAGFQIFRTPAQLREQNAVRKAQAADSDKNVLAEIAGVFGNSPTKPSPELLSADLQKGTGDLSATGGDASDGALKTPASRSDFSAEALRSLAVEMERTLDDRLKQVHAMSRDEIQAFRREIQLARLGGLSGPRASRANSFITSITTEGISPRNADLFPSDRIGEHIQSLRQRSHATGVAGVLPTGMETAFGLLSIGGSGTADEFQKVLEQRARNGDAQAEAVLARITRVTPIEKTPNVEAFEQKFEKILSAVPDADRAAITKLRQRVQSQLRGGSISSVEATALNERIGRMVQGMDPRDARFYSLDKLNSEIGRLKKVARGLGFAGLAPVPGVSNIWSGQSIAAAKNAESLLAEIQRRADNGDDRASRLFRSHTRVLKD